MIQWDGWGGDRRQKGDQLIHGAHSQDMTVTCKFNTLNLPSSQRYSAMCASSVVVQRGCGIGVRSVVLGHGEPSHGQHHIFMTDKNRDGYDMCLTSNARFTSAGLSVSGLIRLGRLIHPEPTKGSQ